MTREDKIKRINDISPETAIHVLLEELLPEMGYNDVKVTHERGNRPENGKDVIASLYDEIEDRKDWTAFVVKKGNISGTSSSVREVEDQVYDCFKYEYKSVVDKLRIRVSKVKVVCNGNISGGAQDKILSNNNFDKANILFWDKEKLVKFIDKHYPSYWIEGSKVYKSYINMFHDNITKDSKLKAIGTSDEKIQRIMQCVVAPRITERVELSDGTVQNKKREISSLLSKDGIVLITGTAGSGKSTLLKSISKLIIEQNSLRNNTEFYPVLLEAIDIKFSEYDVVKALKQYFRKGWAKSLSINVDDLLRTNNLILFVDALDEIADTQERDDVINSIHEFSDKYPRIKVICSTRPSAIFASDNLTQRFHQYKLRNLNLRQVDEFIDNYFSDNLLKSKRLRKSLEDSNILEKLPKTPLSLALITILYDDSEIEIPATITDLYSHFTDILLEKNLIKKSVDIIEFSIKHRIISLLAYKMHNDNTDRVSVKEFAQIIDNYNLDRNRKVDSKMIIDLLTRKSGVLYKSKSNNISFKHLSFQEYFTAHEIFNYKQNEEDLLVKKFDNEWWQNVSIFYGGMNKDAPHFLDKVSSLEVSENIRTNMLHIAGMGKLLQALYNTPAESKLSGLVNSLDNVDRVLSVLSSDLGKISQHPIANFSRLALTQIIYLYFSQHHDSITLQSTIQNLYTLLLSELEESSDLDAINIERKILGLIAVSVELDKYNLSLLVDFTEKRKSDDPLITVSSFVFFKYTYDGFSKAIRRRKDITSIAKKMTKSIKKLRMVDELTKPLKNLAQKENIFEEE